MSGKIHLLESVVADRIAAGEVVERPASAVKELVENALDAGAGRIRVDVEKGGKRLIRVTDDGVGMSRGDAELSLQRHATSKVRTTEDIAHISTLGFRGEALPSIASVSLFRMLTRAEGDEEGTEIRVEGGEIRDVAAAGVAKGTDIEVRTLFSHVPARRKFLKTDVTEWGHIESYLQRCAMCHPEVHWEWRHNGGNWCRLPSVGSLEERLFQLFGKMWREATLPFSVSSSRQGWTFSGQLSRPDQTRNHRKEQYWFINGRPVVHRGLVYALQEGYGARISRGSYPFGVFFLGLPLEDVDVNVHPAKREVRLRNETAVRRMVTERVDQVLNERRGVDVSSKGSFLAKEMEEGESVVLRPVVELKIASPGPEQVEWQAPVSEPEKPEQGAEERERVSEPWMKVIGKTEPGLIMAESEEGIVLVHVQAAFERIYFEELMERFSREATESQALLVPVHLEFSPEMAAFVRQAVPVLEVAGVSIAPMGGNAFMVDALPPAVSSREPERFVRDVVEMLSESVQRVRTARQIQNDQVAAAMARQMSRGRRTEGEAELNWLLRRLRRCDLPYTRPDGRPTMILLSRNEFKRRFQLD